METALKSSAASAVCESEGQATLGDDQTAMGIASTHTHKHIYSGELVGNWVYPNIFRFPLCRHLWIVEYGMSYIF